MEPDGRLTQLTSARRASCRAGAQILMKSARPRSLVGSSRFGRRAVLGLSIASIGCGMIGYDVPDPDDEDSGIEERPDAGTGIVTSGSLRSPDAGKTCRALANARSDSAPSIDSGGPAKPSTR